MRKIIKLFTIFSFILMCVFSACSKYDENTGISLRSKYRRALGDWELTKYEVNGIDSLLLREFPVIRFSFLGVNDDNHVAEYNGRVSGSFWYLEQDNEFLSVSFNPISQVVDDDPFRYLTNTFTGINSYWKILKLKNKSFYLVNDAGYDELFEIRIEMKKI